MKRFYGGAAVVVATVLVAGVAFAYGPGWMGGGMGPGAMGPGAMGPGWMGQRMMGPGSAGGGAGPAGCPMFMAAQAQGPAAGRITEDEAKALAEEYAKSYLPGFTVERVLPFQGRRMVAYQAELKGPGGEKRILHINPWGNVVPFGGPTKG